MSAQMPETILVVEDDVLVRMTCATLIEDAGYRVIEAPTADDALAILEKADRVELLFSDVDMPGSMDGLELAEIVHRRWPDIRLLLTSGHHQLGAGKIPDDGEFMPKPYSLDAVIAQIRALLADKARQ